MATIKQVNRLYLEIDDVQLGSLSSRFFHAPQAGVLLQDLPKRCQALEKQLIKKENVFKSNISFVS